MKITRFPLLAVLAVVGASCASAGDAPTPAAVEQVVVVFKTHFDIGYTDMASNVVHRYRTTMIPGAIMDPARDIVPGANHDLYAVTTGVAMLDVQGRGAGFCAPDAPLVSLGRPGCWKYDPEFVPDKATAFVNLFNNQWTTNFRFWNSGTWTVRIRIWAINRYEADAALITPSLEARLPLLAAVVDGASGKLPMTQRGLELSRKGVQVTAFGGNPDGEGTVLRLWELAGKGGPCRVTLPAGFNTREAQPVNLRGEPAGGPMAVKNGAFTVTLKAFAPAGVVFKSDP